MKRKGGNAPSNPKEPAERAAFARVLADFREKAGLTQEQVGEKSGYEEKYIGALERRKHTPPLTAVIQISNVVNTSPLETL
jgi:transcriptional regulator with XRE-family HTH domain